MQAVSYLNKRYLNFIIITIVSLILPFIRINGAHFFLLNFSKSEVHIFFIKFTSQEFYLMPFFVIILFLGILFLTTVGGRIWCGWSCPQTIFRSIYRDLLQTKILKIYKTHLNKQRPAKKGFKYFLGLFVWGLICPIIASNFIWYFVPPEDFFKFLLNLTEHKVLGISLLIISLWLFVDVAFIAENFCIYVCPYGRIQSIMFDDDTMQVIYDKKRGGKIYDGQTKLYNRPPKDEGLCTGCSACVKICPTHIDIRKGMQLECINCLECHDACSSVMSKFGEVSLINWVSENSLKKSQKIKFIRFKSLAYIFVLSLAIIAIIFLGSKKENMLLNINRTSELYKINKDGNVVNSYLFLLQNTDNKDHLYYFKIDDKNINIIKPKKAIKISAGHKQRIIVSLSSKNLKKGIKPIKINGYAKDDEKINVNRKSIFVYPEN